MSKKNNTAVGANAPAATTPETKTDGKTPEVVNIKGPLQAIVVPKYPGQKVTLGAKNAALFGRSEVDFSTASEADLQRLYEMGSPLVELMK